MSIISSNRETHIEGYWRSGDLQSDGSTLTALRSQGTAS